jgi:ABC-2 type transport system permease protein
MTSTPPVATRPPVRLHTRTEGFVSGVAQESVLERAKRIWAFRRLIAVLVRRDLKVRYSGTALGFLWNILEPLAMTTVYWFVFTQIVNRSIGYQPYILFLVTGQMLWFWFLGSLQGGMRSLRSEAQMVRSTNVPRELWIIRVICAGFVQYLFTLPVIALFAAAYGKVPNHYILLVPVSWVLLFFFVLGLDLILAPVTVLVKDVGRLIPVVIRILFYMTPILYAPENLPKSLRPIAEFNPVAGIMTLTRSMFFPKEFHWSYVLDSVVVTVVVLTIGIFVFRRLERQVLKEI